MDNSEIKKQFALSVEKLSNLIARECRNSQCFPEMLDELSNIGSCFTMINNNCKDTCINEFTTEEKIETLAHIVAKILRFEGKSMSEQWRKILLEKAKVLMKINTI